MPKKKKKIYLLLAGGTTFSDKDGNIWSVQNRDDIKNWLAQMPELNILADLEPVFISGENELLAVDTWQKIALEIDKYFLEADGFVIVSKIDQLINTALAVNFLLQNYKKSLVFTASQISGSSFIDKKEIINSLKLKHGGLGLRTNLINAVQIADQPMPGAAIVFGSRVIPAVKAVEDFSDKLNIFRSIDNTYWGKVDFGINLKSGLSYSRQDTKIFSNISANILIVDDIPGLSWSFDGVIKNYQGLFIKINPYQGLDEAKKKQIVAWGMPTVCYNYLTAQKVDNAVSISDCTFNTALIKFMWYLANAKKLGKYEDVMKQNIINGFNHSK